MDQKKIISDLAIIANELRLKALSMIFQAKSGHPGGSLSAAEIITALYFYKARFDPNRPNWKDRDRIFISKGHCAPIYYAALARAGFFPEEELDTFRTLGSRLQGHPDRRKLPGIEMSSGPLGLGASVAVGCALGLRQQKSTARVYCLLGDGEIQEGIVWEAAMCANKYKLKGLTFILDYNQYQLSGKIAEIMPLEPLEEKWRSFGWRVLPIDGHNMKSVIDALDLRPDTQPTMIIARTVKGKGVSFMENNNWHGRVPSPEQMVRARAEIEEKVVELQGGKEGERQV